MAKLKKKLKSKPKSRPKAGAALSVKGSFDPLSETDETFAPSETGYRLEKGTCNYEFTQKERESLLKRMQRESREDWTEQLEYRRRCLKLEDYAAGRQIFDSTTGRFVGHEIASAPAADNNVDEELTLVNWTGRIHVSNVQRLSGYDIAPIVVPNSSKPDDKNGARIGRVALADLFNNVGEEDLKRTIATIISKYGTVFLKTFFDPSLGPLAHPVKTRKNAETGKTENYIDKTTLEPCGQVVMEAYSPRNVILPRYCRRLKDADRLEEVHVETSDWVWRKFGVKVDAEPQQATTWYTPQAVDVDQRDVEWQWGMPTNGVVVRGRYIRPCPDFQRGAIIFYTDKHILRATTLLDDYDDIPWDMAVQIQDEKSAYGTTQLWDCIPVQDAINASYTSIVNHGKMYGDLQQWAPSSANIKMDKISNATGQINTYQGDKGPEYMEPPDLPEGHFATLQKLEGTIQSLGAAQDISRSNKTLSGNALATLQQMDNSVLKPALKNIADMLKGGCKKALRLMGDFYTAERVIKMTGRSGWEVIEDFTGAALKGNYDVNISLMTGLSDNPIIRQDSVLNALKAQVIGVQEARQYLEMGESNAMLEDVQKEYEVAERAVRLIADIEKYTDGSQLYPIPPPPQVPGSQLPPVQPPDGIQLPVQLHTWDNHPMMIKCLLAYMRENFDEAESEVQHGLTAALQFHQAQIAVSAPPAPAAPPAAFPTGGPPMPPPGPVPAPPPPEGGLDSVQNAVDQPLGNGVQSPDGAPGGAS